MLITKKPGNVPKSLLRLGGSVVRCEMINVKKNEPQCGVKGNNLPTQLRYEILMIPQIPLKLPCNLNTHEHFYFKTFLNVVSMYNL